MKLNAKRAVLEFTSIVVAVILAMSLSELRQNYLNEQLAKKTFKNIVLEVEHNEEQLKRDSAKIAKDLAFIQKWVEDVSEDKKPETFSAGFSLSFLNSSAMEVAEINQSLAFLSMEQHMDLADIYAAQDFYSEHGTKMFDIMGGFVGQMTEPNPKEVLPHVLTLRFHLRIIYNTINAYLEQSSTFLENYATVLASD
ncbi:hypothetical protein [Roseivirga misakiensis]|uniref:Uncharacterized protein n=1 Tax=Roseivirga misakiensis TaxID=1563681 RepID=A0A1E5T6X2_9BACT|nr:hypothetical protein [Roseivirga misakiensis]OEK07096.1 hypothetical protein BFP71_05410 [Roseivirga misakiensis]